MTKPNHPLLIIVFLLLALAGMPASAAEDHAKESVVASSTGDAVRAQALLDRAVEHYRANGEKAFAAFSRAGEFIDGDLYVYVLGEEGVMKASGGPSITLVGRDVRNIKDAEGKLLFKEMFEGAMTQGGGAINYRWLNRKHGKVERKVAYYRKAGSVIIAVGYYIPHASQQAARALLTRSAEAMAKNAEEAIAHFNDVNGGFIEDDLYVFVVGLNDKIMYAHGATPRLIGRNVEDLRDVDGKPIVRQMIDIVKAKGSGKLQYTWANPVTNRKERKTTYLQRVDRYLVAVGHYER